jgi:hypothetical protein
MKHLFVGLSVVASIAIGFSFGSSSATADDDVISPGSDAVAQKRKIAVPQQGAVAKLVKIGAWIRGKLKRHAYGIEIKESDSYRIRGTLENRGVWTMTGLTPDSPCHISLKYSLKPKKRQYDVLSVNAMNFKRIEVDELKVNYNGNGTSGHLEFVKKTGRAFDSRHSFTVKYYQKGHTNHLYKRLKWARREYCGPGKKKSDARGDHRFSWTVCMRFYLRKSDNRYMGVGCPRRFPKKDKDYELLEISADEINFDNKGYMSGSTRHTRHYTINRWIPSSHLSLHMPLRLSSSLSSPRICSDPEHIRTPVNFQMNPKGKRYVSIRLEGIDGNRLNRAFNDAIKICKKRVEKTKKKELY